MLTRRLVLGLAGVAALTVAGCSGAPTSEPTRPDPVALSASLPTKPLLIGLVISLASQPGQGAEWRDAAEGAQVAVRRFALGGTAVQLVVQNDNGTTKGAAQAVQSLIDQRVSGVVMATAGNHVVGAVNTLTVSGIPVLLPYAEALGTITGTAWLTGSPRAVADRRLAEAAQTAGNRRVHLVDAGGGDISGLAPVGSTTYAAGQDADALAARLVARRRDADQTFGAVAVSGPAALQAAVVAALQGAGLTVPYALTGQALSPAFPQALAKAGGSLATPFVSVGIDDGDAAALASSATGRALAAYFSALRMTAADPSAKDLLGDRAYSEVAGSADVASHDAVVALVRAASAADSADPAALARVLPALNLSMAEGLAGAPLTFTATSAAADTATVVLESTSQTPGVRPSGAAYDLYWFARPTS